jgi:glycosyltransferase involved in cell wall biosynthesis
VTSRAYIPLIQGYGIDSNCIEYFPQSVEKLYQPVKVESDAPEHSILPQGFRVLFAGNIGAAQSFGTILDVAEHLKNYPDIQWVIVGDGRMRNWVETEIRKRELTETVHLLGGYPVESMPRFFALADVLLVTLKKDPVFSLTVPGKVQSYLACGKPIVAALDGEGSKLVKEAHAGLICPSEDAGALSDAILAMYRMPKEQREEMGICGIRYYEANFDRDMLIAKLEGWMHDVCRKPVSESATP